MPYDVFIMFASTIQVGIVRIHDIVSIYFIYILFTEWWGVKNLHNIFLPIQTKFVDYLANTKNLILNVLKFMKSSIVSIIINILAIIIFFNGIACIHI